MVFHENRLLADDSHEISYIMLLKIGKDVAKFVVCCRRDWGIASKNISVIPWQSVAVTLLLEDFT